MKHRVILQMSGGGGGGGLFKSALPGRATDGLPEDPLEAARAESAGSDVLARIALDPAYDLKLERDLTEPSPMLFKSAAVDGVPGPVTLGGSHIVRGEVDEADLPRVLQTARRSSTVNVFADPGIAPFLICGGSPPMGTAVDVAQRLGWDALQRLGMDGTGVRVAIVDTGFNLAYLQSLGVQAGFDPQLSWTLPGGPTPGAQNVEHGTMSAFDATIAAPRCTLLDYPVLGQPSGMTSPAGTPMMTGLLSDALLAFNQLLQIARDEPGVPLVVNNSWGMFNPSWDWPVGSPGNYSDNPRHPFNLIVAALDRAGADIVFASGDCGSACPDGRCGGVTNVIYGANSSRSVLCVAGVDITGEWVGYSTQGPGLLEHLKPDIAGFTHFRGSGVFPADSGTSAAAPVVSGLLAAVRTRVPPAGLEPPALRDLVRNTAWRAGPPAFDFNLGWGVVNGPGLVTQLSRTAWDQAAPMAALAGAGAGDDA